VTALRITEITQLNSKQDMSRWTRAHADAPGINWSVYPGPGGTMIIVEHEEDRATFLAAQAAAAAQTQAAAVAEVAETLTTTADTLSFLDFASV
jgi:hypothetical protein